MLRRMYKSQLISSLLTLPVRSKTSQSFGRELNVTESVVSGLSLYCQDAVKTDFFEDLNYLPGGNRKFRRVLLQHSLPRLGYFSRLLGPSEIELIQTIDEKPVKIFKDRFWGDLGFEN